MNTTTTANNNNDSNGTTTTTNKNNLLLLMHKPQNTVIQHGRRNQTKGKYKLLCSIVMPLLPWVLKIMLPLNANQWANIISHQSSVNAPCQMKSRTFHRRAAALESLADYSTTHKNSLKRNFPLGSLDILYAIAWKLFWGRRFSSRVFDWVSAEMFVWSSADLL